MSAKKYDSTVARIAGNLLSGDSRAFDVSYSCDPFKPEKPTIRVNAAIVQAAVATARAIVAEVERTEPAPSDPAGATPSAKGATESAHKSYSTVIEALSGRKA